MAPTIGYDATAAVRQAAGIGRYTRELLRALVARDDAIRYRLFSASGGETFGSLPELDWRFRHRAIPLSDRVTNAIWHRARLPLPARLVVGSFDLFHSPDFTLPPVGRKPAILTVHDLAFMRSPQTAYPPLRAYLQRAVPRSARRADRVIAVSQATRRDVIELLDIHPRCITVIPEAVGDEFRPLKDEAMGRKVLTTLGIRAPYILSVGTLEPRKNYARLFEAYALLRKRGVTHRLVIAGRRGWLFRPTLARLVDLGLEESVDMINPSDAELVPLYGMADCFVYPSLYEGFGIPPLEALACGIPVACSSSSSLPEVVGEAALLFDPLDVEAIASVLERILGDAGLRAELALRGPQQAAGFTWHRAAEATVRLYREVLDAA